MKRVFFIFSMVLALLLGGIPADAKTSSKHKSAKTHQSSRKSQNAKIPKEFGPSVFFKKDKYNNIIFKNNINKTLINLGFKQNGPIFFKDGISVEFEFSNFDNPDTITIEFPNSSERNKFIEKTKSYGWVWDGTECIGGSIDICFTVKNNSIEMFCTVGVE